MKKLLKIFCVILVLGIIINTQSFVLGQDSAPVSDEVQSLNNEISSKRDKLKELEDQQKKYTAAIQSKQSEQASLANQLSIIEDSLSRAKLEIESNEIEIDRVNLEIKKTNLEIETKKSEIESEKEHMSNILRLLYKEDRTSTLEMMLMNNSLSDFLNQMKYLEDVNGEVGKSLEELTLNESQLEKDLKNLDGQNKQLLTLRADLDNKKALLENESDNKAYVMEQSRNSEQQYQKLLKQAKQEQAQASSEIASLEKTVREKLANADGTSKLESNSDGLIWPVPKNTITAYFHDPDYPFRYVYEHPAIDIRAKQGTSIKAAASGYVAIAKDAGMGYSYIMIIHADGLSTVYGHVSKIFVSNEEYVSQGQIIGLSGGMPGTPGAGKMSTGSHLHFEVRSGGIPVNALNYLQ
jgi:murein DD-endopeptidase MepM/ murein hydrolase activator NlpD